jgi:hypothetical protein
MAVIQISKIQVRRGRKLETGDIPQLSSAEFAWAIDTQELFIGNGSISEGAPYVGNTKILTEHDNILDFASSYRYGANNTSITLTEFRSIQDKIDEIEVSVNDFAAVGDGQSDNSQSFRNAISQLFQNTDTSLRKILKVPNGEYVFLEDLEIPSGVVIRGENNLETILNIGSNNITFLKDNELELSSTNRPRNVYISNLTIRNSDGSLVLTNLADSKFESIIFSSDYEFGDGVVDAGVYPPSVYWENQNVGTAVTNITFSECNFNKTAVAVRVNQDNVLESNVFDTEIFFEDCHFSENYHSVLLTGNVNGQGNLWKFNNCIFRNIEEQVLYFAKGRGTVIKDSKFFNCGNSINNAATPSSNMIFFGERIGNLVLDCSGNRHQLAHVTDNEFKTAVAEVINANKASFIDINYSEIFKSDSPKPLSIFSAFNTFTYIDYTLTLGTLTRKGLLTLTVDADRTQVSVTDEYSYSSKISSTPEGIVMTNFEFDAELKDNDSDNEVETIVLRYRNLLNFILPDSTEIEGLSGNITYSVSYGV